jgi:hypothetical protein
VTEPFHTVLRVVHGGGGGLAFAVAPLALLTIKGSRRHILAGQCFIGVLGTGVTAGILLSVLRPQLQLTLLLLGLVTVFFIATGYLAPRIGRGSRGAYRWDQGLTAVGVLASVGLVYTGLLHTTVTAPVQEGVVFGGLGLWVATAHARWRGPADPARWRVEHLTSRLAAYTVVWAFIFGLYIRVLPEAARVLIPAGLGTVAMLWARRRFGGPSMVQGPTAAALTGAA